MRAKKIIRGIFFIVLSTSMIGCGSEKNSLEYIKEQEGETYNYFQDIVLGENEDAVCNIYGAYFGIYNTKNNTYSGKYEKTASTYLGTEGTDIFTIGSNENKFSIVRMKDGVVKKLYDVPEKDAIYPIGEYKNEYYFVYCIDDWNEKVNRNIVKYDESKQELQTVLETHNENIMNAVFVRDNLYFNVYHENKKGEEFYDLYMYDMNTGERKAIKEDMQSEKIYEYDNKLLYEASDEELRSLDGNESYNIKKNIGSNRVEGKYGLLFQIYISDGADCQCIVTKLSDQKEIVTVNEFIGYKITDHILKLYSRDGIKSITLESER